MRPNRRSCVRGFERATGRGARPRLSVIVASMAIVPALAGCSSFFSSPSSSSPPSYSPTAAGPPPAPYSPTAAAGTSSAPYSATAAGASPSPYSSTAATVQSGRAPATGSVTTVAAVPAATSAPPATPPDQTAAADQGWSFVGILNMFRDQRDPSTDATTIEEARSFPPRQSAASTAGVTAPVAGPPPGSYAAAAPAPAYSGPPNAYNTAAAAPPPAARPSDGVYPSVSLVDLFRNSGDSTPPANPSVPHPPSTYTPVSTAAAAPAAAAAPSDPRDGVYPSVSLVDFFKGSTNSAPPASTPSANPNALHPPSTYTPAADAPPANPPASASPYPQQSLFDLFSKKSDGQ